MYFSPYRIADAVVPFPDPNKLKFPDRPMLSIFRTPITAVGLSFFAAFCPATAETLFSHTFNEGTGGLNGTSVDVGAGSWVAFGGINANGLFNSDASLGGSATLAFSPSHGFTYHLDARITGVVGDANWVALGFANGQSAATGANYRFITAGGAANPGPVGTAWMLFRGNNTANTNSTFLGTGILSSTSQGTLNGEAWSSLNNSGGGIDLRIVLDTTGGSGNWTATWLAKNIADPTYTTLRAAVAVPVADEARYTSVGFAFSNGAIDGILESFSLSNASAPPGSIAPYGLDAHTRHLWHFDETDPGPAQPAAGIIGSFNLTPENNASLGVASASGLTTAGETLAATSSGFRGAMIPVSAVTGPDGAFTFEALIRTSNITDLQQIITMENASGLASDRPFQFRIDAGNLRFINVSAGSQSLLAAIPTTGPDAFIANQWFHVAVAYNGNEGATDNLQLYWTRLDPSRTAANPILSATMAADLGGIATTFGVGQDYRNSVSNLKGRIDEVRISNIARGATGFVFSAPDTDSDDLADRWEILHFRESLEESEAQILAKYNGEDDPDDDGFSNLEEFTADTDPNDPGHTPLDVDRDGYEDAWELATFGTITYGPNDDPDGDNFTTADELAAGTDPANARFHPEDTDGDGLNDAMEVALFGNLSQGPLDDFDGDGISNLAEINAGTDATDPIDYPVASLIHVTDGNPSTDENGYAGSAINSIAFAQNNLITVGDQQFISFYRRHATDAGHPANNTVVVARRQLGEVHWEIFPTNFVSFNINDTHNVISCAIDGDGYLHMSWGMHVHSLLYAKSDAPVTGTAPIQMVSLGTAGMTGQETTVTYPKFQTLPDGDVVFLFRMGGSGNGDWYLHRYNHVTKTWSPIHTNTNGTTRPLFQGRGQNPNNCFYPDRLTLGPDGMLHLSGVFRYNSSSQAGETGYQTNHRYVYLRSPDRGDTWQRSDGSTISLPVINNASFLNLGPSHVPEIVEDLPEGHSIINEQGMTTDSAGRPIIATWFAANAASGDHTRQYHIYFHNGTIWQRRTVSARNLDNPATKFSEAQLGASRMGRPVVLTDADDRIIVIYNDNRFDGITVVFTLPLAQDPDRLHWTRINITSENLGSWETTYDEERWKRDGVLQMLYQKLPGSGMSYSGQNNSTPVSVLEWNASAYFNHPIRWQVDTQSTPGQAKVLARTQIGFRYDLKTSTDLGFSAPPVVSGPGNGDWLDFGTWPMNEPRRFWRIERVEETTNDL
jgi:hypothetical protein